MKAALQNETCGIALEEMCRDVLLDAHVGLFRTNMNSGQLLDANECVARFIGFESRAALLAEPFSIAERYVNASDRDRMIEKLNQNGSFEDFEAPFRRNDGSVLWMRYSARLIQEKGWIVGIAVDITAEKAAAVAAEKSEKKYRDLVEHANEAIFVATAGKIVFVNSATEDIFGYSEKILSSKPFTDFIHPLDRELVLDRHLRRINGEDSLPGVYTFRVLHQNGGTRWVQLRTVGIDWENERATLNFLNDITELRENIIALEERDQLLQCIARVTGLLISEPHMDNIMIRVLSELGRATRADRAYVFKNNTHPETGKLCMSHMWEWAGKDVSPELDNSLLQNLPYEQVAPELLEHCLKRRAWQASVAALDAESRTILESQNIKSILQVPIYVQDRLWGFIGFDDCTKPRQWFQAEIAALQTAADTLGGVIGRQEMEDALRQSECQYRGLSRMLRLMCDNVPDMIWAKDLKKRFTFVNKAIAYNLLGAHDTKEPIGKTDMFFAKRERHSHEENPQWHTFGEICRDSDSVVMQNRKAECFEEYGNVKGHFLFLDVHKAPLFDEDGDMIGTVGSARDVTLAKAIEARFRESEEMFRLLAESAPLGVMLFQGNKLIYANPHFQKITGLPQMDFDLRRLMEIIHREDHTKLADAWHDGRKGQTGAHYEVRILDKSARIRWVDLAMAAASFHDRPALIVTMMDITVRKETEVEKDRLQQQFIQAQKMESVGRLAGGVAHDFNNILVAVMGNTDLALIKAEKEKPFQEHLKEVQKAANRAASLIRQLLAFARKQTVRPTILDLNETISGMFKMIGRLIGEDIQLAFLPQHKLWKVKIDPSQVDQILANLAVNARDAISGIGSLTIETANVVLDHRYCSEHAGARPGEYVLLTVKDNGSGMEDNMFRKIFEPFFTTKERGQGTGLGLSTVWGIVKQNDGYIELESELCKGTAFRIYFPRCGDETIQPEAMESLLTDPRQGNETLLVVEDDEAILQVCTEILESIGYTVLGAQTPRQAIQIADEHGEEIHLLLSDVVMPEMNGWELSRKISASRKHLKVLFMSGYPANAIARFGVLEEGVQLIHKPFSMEKLASRIRDILDGG